jgi:toxin ParE1/3/4
VTRIELAPGVAGDFERILIHLAKHEAAAGASRIEDIVQAFDVLGRNPLLGRPAGDGKRELVIGKRSRGYVALYEYLAERDLVRVLAIRAQREAGYDDSHD